MDGLCFLSTLFFQTPLDSTDSSYPLLQFLFRMTIRFINWLGRFTQIIEVAQLVGQIGKDGDHRFTDGVLPVRDDPTDRNIKYLLHLIEQTRENRLTGAQQAPSEKHFTRKTIAQNPKDFVTDIWL